MFKNLKTIKVILKRNLLRSIKRGEPWLYSDAIDLPSTDQVSLCKIEYKKKLVAWGFFDPKSPIKVRIISTSPKWNKSQFTEHLKQTLSDKKAANLSPQTDCYRALNGEGDFTPGLICDVYAELAVLQADGQGPYEVYDFEAIAELVKEVCGLKAVYYKARNQHKVESGFVLGECVNPVLVKENGCKFWVNFIEGQKTGFFLDQRNNRAYIKKNAKSKSLLNLFSYTGGFSIAAGCGGASEVYSLDIARPAAEYCDKNWIENSLEASKHKAIAKNVFDYLDECVAEDKKFDMVICDPPSFSNNESGKQKAVQSYIDVFSKAIKTVNKKGDIVLSSCSSHISYEDFFEISEESLSAAKRTGKVVFMGSQGEDHCYPVAFKKMQYLKFLHIKLID